jgi:hypothetical protein
VRRVAATLNGKHARVVRVRRAGRTLRVTVGVRGGGAIAVRALLEHGRPVRTTALYRPCPSG